MTIFKRFETNPAFNLAAEEFLLKEFDDDVFSLWRNETAIIVGKHQNTRAEIHFDEVQKNHIPVIRRLSGGGAVFHDLGNICFTFVKSKTVGEPCDFATFTKPVVEVLQSLGIDAKFTGRNDLTIDEKKISGNAEAVWKNRILHHGTLLFSSKIEDLSRFLNVHADKFQDKAVKSVDSRVTNIEHHLTSPITILDFMNLLEDYVLKAFPNAVCREFSDNERKKIQTLANEKYQTWDWNFGYSPTYNFSQRLRTKAGGSIEILMNVERGIIQEVQFFGDFFEKNDLQEFATHFIGEKHNSENISKKLDNLDVSRYFRNITKDEMLVAFGC